MSSPAAATDRVVVRATNVGGIDETEVSFSSGVTVLSGRNATNRTSFLQSVMAALGSDRVSLKGDATEGNIELTVDDETHTRTLHRQNGRTVLDGDPYLEDAAVADLFAFLLESNEARRAVERGDDLRELVMRPIDTDAIETEIRALEAEKRDLTDDLAELDRVEDEVHDLEAERDRLESELADVEEELDERTAALDALDVDAEDAAADRDAVEERLTTLQDRRGDFEDVRFDLDTQRESLAALREEREDLRAELAALPEADAEAAAGVDERIEALRERKREIETETSELQSVISFNRERLAEGHDGVADAIEDEDDDGAVTDALVRDGVTCWTCGSAVDRDQIAATVERLEEFRDAKRSERDEVNAELADLEERREEREERERRRSRLERRIDDVTDEIDRRESEVARLEGRRDDLRERVEEIEDEIAALERDEYDELLERHREVNELEFERDRLADELDSVESDLAAAERRLDERPDLEAERERVGDRLTELRTRVEQIERDAVERFNEHMNTVLDLLDYANIERIWLERTGSEGANAADAAFDLHVVRESRSGAAYEDSIDHLSESEREVTGLVFALAGYLVHDVHESVPFVLLDSLESIDADRIAAVVEYFGQYAEHLVVALLPEDAAALDEQHQRVESI